MHILERVTGGFLVASSKYRDRPAVDPGLLGGFEEHQLHLTPARKYDPAAGGDDGEGGTYSHLIEFCSGDWSWKPLRDKLLGENFKTYRPGLHPLAGIRF